MENSILRKSKHSEMNFELQITALIDTLVIILIFLLKTIAMESLEDTGTKGLRPPSINNGYSTGTGDKLIISQDAIIWNNTEAFKLKDIEGNNSETEWNKLNALMAKKSEKTEPAAKDGNKIFLQADKAIPFKIIERALKIARQNSYKDIRFIGAKYN